MLKSLVLLVPLAWECLMRRRFPVLFINREEILVIIIILVDGHVQMNNLGLMLHT